MTLPDGYEDVLFRQSWATGRLWPDPTMPTTRGNGRTLSPLFAEWMMGLPEGWVTDHLPRAKALKALGNGVVPQQAAYAWRLLVKGGEYAEGQ